MGHVAEGVGEPGGIETERLIERSNGETTLWPKYRTTTDMIKAIREGRFPQKAMITIHPQRWTNNPALWLRELIWQNTKNVIKKYYFVNREKYSVS